MKKSKLGSCWRPLMGVVAVGALALGVSVLAAPRAVDDSAVRGTNKGKTEVTRLVTGDPAQINAVIAGSAPSVILSLSPVANKGAPGPVFPAGVSLSYPAGTTITGTGVQTLTAASGGFRAFFEVTVKDWDLNGDGTPGMHTAQLAVDPAGYLGSNASPSNPGVNIAPSDSIVCGVIGACTAGVCVGGSAAGETCAVVADCNGGRRCRDNFAESWAKCDLGFCKAGYVAKTGGPANNYCGLDPDGCNQGDVDTSSFLYRFFDIATLANVIDGHILYYVGSLALDIPAGAKGTYVVGLDGAQTYVEDADGFRPDTKEENGFIVHIPTGSCCQGLGTTGATCLNNFTKPECDAAPASSVWGGEGSVCTAEGTDEDCAACTIPGRNTDPRCDDGDSCTNDDCEFPPGICSHFAIDTWDPGTECCEGGGTTGVTTLLEDNDVCTVDTCVNTTPTPSPAMENGTATHSAAAAEGLPCNDGNPCSTPDLCNGLNGQNETPTGCVGQNVNLIECGSQLPPCPLTGNPNDPTERYPCGAPGPEGFCFCTLTPKATFVLNTPAPKTCSAGTIGAPCAKDADCGTNGVCDLFAAGANCFDSGEKVTAVVHFGSAGGPINGGQLQIDYDPTCLDLNTVTCMEPYVNEIYRAINEAAGKIFIACGVDPFAGVNGPLGNTNMVSLNFTKIGACNECELCFASKNPQNSYLMDDAGQRVEIEPQCKKLQAKGDLVLDVPDSVKVNSDCDGPTAVVTWNPPTATFSCGTANLTCRGASDSGLTWGLTCEGGLRNGLLCGTQGCPGGTCVNKVMNGGEFPQGASSFCCYAAAKDECDQHVGCPGAANACGTKVCQGTTTACLSDSNCASGVPCIFTGKPVGCWTVEVSDQTSLDIHVELEPPIMHDDRGGEMTRCIKFCLYGNCAEDPICVEETVTFGGLFNFIGKVGDKIKIPKGKWACITAQDQLHTLRSCDNSLLCIDGQLMASFKGDPQLGGNWLIGGNLDGWKKDDPTANPSLDVIDILDYGTFVSQYGVTYADNDTDCSTVGPNADINGDGDVTMADYNFIIRNFLVSAKDCCCGPQAASLPPPLTEVSVDQLRQMGLGELVVADLNGDGLVNAQDMDAFMQGARPTKTSNDRKGGKGLRSGR